MKNNQVVQDKRPPIGSIMTKVLWTFVGCPDCEDGIIYSLSCGCQGACDHDRMCPRCRGLGYYPSNDLLDLFGATEVYPNRRAAWAEIEKTI